MESFKDQKNPNAYGLIDYIASKELNPYIQSLKPKANKKKPLSFERLNLMVMPIFKYFETEKAQETSKVTNSLNTYTELVLNHTNININTQFET